MPASSQVWGRPVAGRGLVGAATSPRSQTSLGGIQVHNAGKQLHGPHHPHPQAVLTVSPLKPHAADGQAQASPPGLPQGWLNLWLAVSNAKISLYSLKQGMGREHSGKNTEHIYHPQLPLGFLPTLIICSLQTAPQLPDTLPALPRGMGSTMPSPRISMLQAAPWLQRLGGCRLWLSLEDPGLVAAAAPAPQRETYEQV